MSGGLSVERVAGAVSTDDCRALGGRLPCGEALARGSLEVAARAWESCRATESSSVITQTTIRGARRGAATLRRADENLPQSWTGWGLDTGPEDLRTPRRALLTGVVARTPEAP